MVENIQDGNDRKEVKLSLQEETNLGFGFRESGNISTLSFASTAHSDWSLSHDVTSAIIE